MALVDIKCAECAAKLKISEHLVGTTIKCPKCRESFVAEVGDSYGLTPEPAKPQPSRAERPMKEGKPAKRAAKPAKPQKPETKAERAQREMLEKWSKSME